MQKLEKNKIRQRYYTLASNFKCVLHLFMHVCLNICVRVNMGVHVYACIMVHVWRSKENF